MTNVLISNLEVVSGLSEPAARTSTTCCDLRCGEQPASADETQVITSYNTPIGTPVQPVQDKATKAFRQAFEEQMQAENPSGQSYPVPADVPNDLSAASDGPAPQAGDLPQQELVVQTSRVLAQVLYDTALSAPVYLNGGQDSQISTGSMAGMPESAGAITELAGRVESRVIQPAPSNVAAALNPQPVEGAQVEPTPTLNDVLEGGQGAPVEVKNAGLAGESLIGCEIALAEDDSPDPVQQTSVNAQPASQGDQGMVKAVFSVSEPATQESSPIIPEGNYEESGSNGSAGQQGNVLSEYPDDSVTGTVPGEDSLSGDSLAQKVNVAQSEAPTAQAKGSNTQTRDGGGSFEFEHVVSVENLQNARVEHPVAAAQPVKSPGNPGANDAYSTVGEQIRESVRSSIGGSDREITVRLNPPELGRVVIRFHQQDDQITGILEVSKSQTRAEVQQELPGIARDLLELGVQVKRLEVVIASEQQQQSLNGWSATAQQNGWGSQQGATSPNPNAPYPLANEFTAEDSEYTGFTGRSRTYVTEKSIDIFA
ncbi:MAG: flagellar hook-length control protein FliK [Sedimentisphaerales bacterium]|nr:flagellar hook-length control protein FliK [Sedimentisphaerales bacterium]